MTNGIKRDCINFKCTLLILVIPTCVALILSMYFSFLIFPEVNLILQSQCAHNFSSVEIRKSLIKYILPKRIKKNNILGAIQQQSVFKVSRSASDFTNYIITKNMSFIDDSLREYPVFVIGTHHKTGTYLARKLFSKVCDKMKWCCIFHVTHDSFGDVYNSLLSNKFNLLSHNQWLWLPQDFGLQNYKFIHFYRHPYQKIISGYRYHQTGVEDWTKRKLTYRNICNISLLDSTDKNSFIEEYCECVHLCAACCRMELQKYTTVYFHNKTNYIDADRQIICKYLSTVNESLQKSLNSESLNHGLAIEATIDYYENLRMARVLNETRNDNRTLNIDLDFLMSNFEFSIRKIVDHLNLQLSENDYETLVKSINFYDTKSSYLYKWSMTQSPFNHINTNRNENQVYIKYLERNADIANLYKRVFELLPKDFQ